MNTNTLKVGRKAKQERIKAKELAEERSARLERACKRFNLSGANLTPEGEISLLDKYVQRLVELKAEFENTYAGLLTPKNLYSFDIEIGRALEHIVDLKIKSAEPGGNQ